MYRYEAALSRLMGDVAREAVSREEVRLKADDAANHNSTTTANPTAPAKTAEPKAKRLARAKKDAPLADRLLARVASSFCLTLNKCDLVQPKLYLLPAAEEFDRLLQTAVRAAVADAVASSLAGGREPEQPERPAAQRGSGKVGDRRLLPEERLPIEIFFVSATAGMAEAGVGFRSSSAAAVAATQSMAKKNNSGVKELRRFLHAAAVLRPWETAAAVSGGSTNASPAAAAAAASASFEADARSLMAAVAAGATEWEAPKEDAARDDDDATPPAAPLHLLTRTLKGGGGYDAVATELDDREFAQELIREKCFQYLHKEVGRAARQRFCLCLLGFLFSLLCCSDRAVPLVCFVLYFFRCGRASFRTKCRWSIASGSSAPRRRRGRPQTLLASLVLPRPPPPRAAARLCWLCKRTWWSRRAATRKWRSGPGGRPCGSSRKPRRRTCASTLGCRFF